MARDSLEQYSEDVTGRESVELELEERAEMEELKEELDFASEPLLGRSIPHKATLPSVPAKYNTSRVSSSLVQRVESRFIKSEVVDSHNDPFSPLDWVAAHYYTPFTAFATLQRSLGTFPLFNSRIFRSHPRSIRFQSTPFHRFLFRYTFR